MTNTSDNRIIIDTEYNTGLDIKKLEESGHKVVVMGSSDGLSGVVDAIKKAEAEGVKPIVVIDSYSDVEPDKAIAFKPREEVGELIPERRKRPLWDKKKSDNRMASAFIAAACGWGMGEMYGAKRSFDRSSPKQIKCGLPGCGKMSMKEYCCADHCREHRRLGK